MNESHAKPMWSHYCWSERCTISLLAGESCNWCEDTPQIMLEGLDAFNASAAKFAAAHSRDRRQSGSGTHQH